MTQIRTKSLQAIEGRMQEVDKNSIRYQILQDAKNFKTSWIELGQALYTVWKDKLYKEWGYLTFEAYSAKEVGIKKPTALKLLKSYYFLEREDPGCLEKKYTESKDPALVPSYESVNALRLAKNKNTLDDKEYTQLKKDVLEKGKDAGDVRRNITGLIRQKEEMDPEEARKKRSLTTIKRLLAILKSLKREMELSKVVSSAVIKETAGLINKIEAEIS